MKSKKILLALPIIAILAGCSAKIEGYNDIFYAAKNLTEETKAEVSDEMTDYSFMGTRKKTTVVDGEEIGSSEKDVSILFHDNEGSKSASYALGGVEKYAAKINEGTGEWEGKSANGLTFENLFDKFRTNVFSWNGHILVGDYDVLPYEANIKLTNAVSKRFTKQQKEKSGLAAFTFETSSPAAYTDGQITYSVNHFKVVYADYKISEYAVTFQLVVNEENISITTEVSGTFAYAF